MHTDYDAYFAAKRGGRPSFTIAGQTFTARAKIPWKKYSRMLIDMSEGVASSEKQLQDTEDFFSLVLVARDRDRFIRLLNFDGEDEADEDRVADPAQIGKILDDLMDYYTGKEMESGENSSDKPAGSGQPSNVVSLNAHEA